MQAGAPAQQTDVAGNDGDMPCLPHPLRMAFCVGVQKGGTSWLHHWLKTHPACHFGAGKEPHYFDAHFWERGPGMAGKARARVADLTQQLHDLGPAAPQKLRTELQSRADWLERAAPGREGRQAYVRHLTRGAGTARLMCDFTPRYGILGRDAFCAMQSLARDVRFVFILRDPVARFWSQLRMQRKAEGRDTAGFEAKVAQQIQRAEGGDLSATRAYRHTVRVLDDVAGAGAVHYAFYETMFEQAQLDRITAFLDIAPHPAPVNTRIRAGEPLDLPAETKHKLTEIFAPDYAFVRQRFGNDVPRSWAA